MPSSDSIRGERMCFRGGLCYKSVLSWFFGKILLQANSPPRRGGVAAPPRKCREATEAAQTGWREARAREGEASIEARRNQERAGLLLRLRPAGLALRATAPLRGGE